VNTPYPNPNTEKYPLAKGKQFITNPPQAITMEGGIAGRPRTYTSIGDPYPKPNVETYGLAKGKQVMPCQPPSSQQRAARAGGAGIQGKEEEEGRRVNGERGSVSYALGGP
jgi:hypothetical protein